MFDAFYSDPHFGHSAIIEYENRPFSSIEEMNETMVLWYNEVVGPNHVCLWLGDSFLMPHEQSKSIMDKLNGNKVIIPGNHDRSNRSLARLGFIVITSELVFEIGGKTVRASHYPYLNMNSPYVKELTGTKLAKLKRRHPCRIKGEILIHGHTHGYKRRSGNMINVGVDAWGYRPATKNEIEKEIAEI